MKRTVTLRMELEDREASNAIWDAHATGSLILGGRITGISSGDMFAEVDAYDSILEDLLEDTNYETQTKADDLIRKYLSPVTNKNMEGWRE